MSDIIDFEDLTIDIDDDFDVPTEKVAPSLPLATPASMVPTGFSTPPYDVGRDLKLISEPEKLFNFKGTKLTPLQQMYIVSYATKGTKKGACQLAGISYNIVDRWMKSEEFTEALSNAVGLVQDSLEEELLKRAMNGSDKLLLEALKALKPDRYAVKSTQDVNISGNVVHTWSDLAKQAMVEATFEEVKEDSE